MCVMLFWCWFVLVRVFVWLNVSVLGLVFWVVDIVKLMSFCVRDLVVYWEVCVCSGGSLWGVFRCFECVFVFYCIGCSISE